MQTDRKGEMPANWANVLHETAQRTEPNKTGRFWESTPRSVQVGYSNVAEAHVVPGGAMKVKAREGDGMVYGTLDVFDANGSVVERVPEKPFQVRGSMPFSGIRG